MAKRKIVYQDHNGLCDLKFERKIYCSIHMTQILLTFIINQFAEIILKHIKKMLRKSSNTKFYSPKQFAQFHGPSNKPGKVKSPSSRDYNHKNQCMVTRREYDDVPYVLRNLLQRTACLQESLKNEKSERKKEINYVLHKIKHSKCKNQTKGMEQSKRSYLSPVGLQKETHQLGFGRSKTKASSQNNSRTLDGQRQNNQSLKIKALEMLVKNIQITSQGTEDRLQKLEKKLGIFFTSQKQSKQNDENTKISAIIETMKEMMNKKISQISQKYDQIFQNRQSKQNQSQTLEEIKNIVQKNNELEQRISKSLQNVSKKIQQEILNLKKELKQKIDEQISLINDQNKLLSSKIQRISHNFQNIEQKQASNNEKLNLLERKNVKENENIQKAQIQNRLQQQKITEQIQNIWKVLFTQILVNHKSHKTISTECALEEVSIVMEDKEKQDLISGEYKLAVKPQQNTDLQELMEIISGNSTFLEQQVMTLQNSLRQVISIMNWMIGKVNRYL